MHIVAHCTPLHCTAASPAATAHYVGLHSMSAVRCPLAKVGCQAAEPAKALFAQWEKSIYKMAKMIFYTPVFGLLSPKNQEISKVS